MDAILDWKYETRSIPEAGLEVVREAKPEERQAIARAMDFEACSRLVARYRLRPIGDGRYRLKGDVAVDVTQTCVVTADPLERSYSVPVDIELWPAELLEGNSETEIDPLAPHPEPIEDDGRIDVGRIIYEELASTIDPYPRRAGAVFDWEDDGADATDNPFAALARLKRQND